MFTENPKGVISFRFVYNEQDVVLGTMADSKLHQPIPALSNSRPETRHVHKSFPPRAARETLATEGHLDATGSQKAEDLTAGGYGGYH